MKRTCFQNHAVFKQLWGKNPYFEKILDSGRPGVKLLGPLTKILLGGVKFGPYLVDVSCSSLCLALLSWRKTVEGRRLLLWPSDWIVVDGSGNLLRVVAEICKVVSDSVDRQSRSKPQVVALRGLKGIFFWWKNCVCSCFRPSKNNLLNTWLGLVQKCTETDSGCKTNVLIAFVSRKNKRFGQRHCIVPEHTAKRKMFSAVLS